jgi:hypothetical protein
MALRIRHSTRQQPAVTPHKKPHPLFWLLILAALMAFVWAMYNRSASHASTLIMRPAPTAPAATRPANRVVEGQPLRPARTSRPPRP